MNIGPPTRLTLVEEEEIVSSIGTGGDWNYPVMSLGTRFIVKHYLERISVYISMVLTAHFKVH